MFDGYWVITKHEYMREVLGDPATFSSTVPVIPRLAGADMSYTIPTGLDPPVHTSYRRVLGTMFSPSRIAALEKPPRDPREAGRDGKAVSASIVDRRARTPSRCVELGQSFEAGHRVDVDRQSVPRLTGTT
jgi:hypothetical protein